MCKQQTQDIARTSLLADLAATGRLATLLLLFVVLPGCVGTVVGAAVDTTIEVAKVPFKVGGAVVDLASGDDEDDD